MDRYTFQANALTTLLAVIACLHILAICVRAYEGSTTKPNDPSVYDLWNITQEGDRIGIVKEHLISNGWVSDKVSSDDLDRIVTMTTQLSSHYDDISAGLVLAMISVESRFNQDCLSSGGARGLMQLIPSYHEDRLIQFLDEDVRYSRDLFYEPLYNIMTGMDYLNERLKECEGDLAYALMQYNQGPSSAYKTYKQKGITSKYAKQIITLSEELNSILES